MFNGSSLTIVTGFQISLRVGGGGGVVVRLSWIKIAYLLNITQNNTTYFLV